MTKNQIIYFLEVARQKNITNAAKKLFVSQQVVSRQIRKIEDEVGFPLFERNSRQLKLTEGGLLLHDFYNQITKEEKEVISKARNVMKTRETTLKIGILNISRIYDWIAEASSVFEQTATSYMLQTEIGSFTELFKKIISGQLDLIISLADESRELPEQIIRHNICEIWPRIIISDRHPAFHENLTLPDLKNDTLYILSNHFSKYAMKNTIAHCQECGLDTDNIIVFNDIASMEMALLNGNGFTISYEQYFRNTTGHLHFFPAGDADIYCANHFMVAYDATKDDALRPFALCLANMDM